MPSLRCATSGLKKAYGKTPILRGIDLEIPEGSFAVLVGPSGCGKSTLLRTVAGLETADEGTVTLAGRDVTQLEPRERDVAMVFQSYALYPHLTVRDNLAFGLKLRKTEAKVIEQRVREASAMLGLDLLLERLPKQLSGGQRQRVAMGRAVVRRAALYLFDEPLSNLDAALRADVRVQIRKLHERIGATSLYVTHDQVEAMTLADTLWVLNQGKVEQKGPPLDIYDKPQTKFVAGFLGSPRMNFLAGVLEGEGARTHAIVHNARIPVGSRADATNGRAVILGIRPQDARAVSADEPASSKRGASVMANLSLTIDLVELLGSEAHAHGTVHDTSFVSSLTQAQARTARPGDVLPIAIDPTRIHVFDATTERALDAVV